MKPIAQLLREQRRKKLRTEDSVESSNQETPKSLMSLEEQIAMLEKEVDSDEESDDDEGEDDEESHIDDEDGTLLVEKDAEGNVVRIVSSLQQEARIAPLPKSLLPSKQCKFASHGSSNATSNKGGPASSHERKRKISFIDEQKSQESGLVKTVRELLNNYQPASSTDRKPFYCRVCQFQGKDVDDWNTHRETEFHKTAVELERRMCFCKLCRKQFTSPDQIKEHLGGKAHLERLEKVRQAQSERKKYC